jgi:hypothetical protein
MDALVGRAAVDVGDVTVQELAEELPRTLSVVA